MSDITVRALGEDEWEQYRSVRLSALEESPEAFVATADEERAYEEDFWRDRMRRSQRLVAEQDGARRSAWPASGRPQAGEKDNDKVAELFGLWVAPAARGTGVATPAGPGRRRRRPPAGPQPPRLLGRRRQRARRGLRQRLRLPPHRQPPADAGPGRGDDDEDEVAMVLPLGEDRGVPNL